MQAETKICCRWQVSGEHVKPYSRGGEGEALWHTARNGYDGVAPDRKTRCASKRYRVVNRAHAVAVVIQRCPRSVAQTAAPVSVGTAKT